MSHTTPRTWIRQWYTGMSWVNSCPTRKCVKAHTWMGIRDLTPVHGYMWLEMQMWLEMSRVTYMWLKMSQVTYMWLKMSQVTYMRLKMSQVTYTHPRVWLLMWMRNVTRNVTISQTHLVWCNGNIPAMELYPQCKYIRSVTISAMWIYAQWIFIHNVTISAV